MVTARGYPAGDQGERCALLSVEHPYALAECRAARLTAERGRTGAATTEELRKALAQYHLLFGELLATPGHEDGTAWSNGNRVVPLIHGAGYFAALVACVRELREGDLLLFTDWRGDPDQLLQGAEEPVTVSQLLCAAARRPGQGSAVALASGPAALQRQGEPVAGMTKRPVRGQ